MKRKVGFLFLVALLIIGLLLAFAGPVAAAPVVLTVQGQAGPITVDLTSEFIGMVAGVVLSLACSYIPGLATAYQNLTDDWKRLVMLILLAAVTAAIMGLGCTGIIGGVDCSQSGIINAVLVFLSAMVANQSTHNLSPRIGAKRPSTGPTLAGRFYEGR